MARMNWHMHRGSPVTVHHMYDSTCLHAYLLMVQVYESLRETLP